MVLTNIITGLFLVFLGWIIRAFKMSFLIAGYNTASPQKKAEYDEKALVRIVGNYLMILGGIIFSGGLFGVLLDNYEMMIIVSWVLFSVAVVIGLIYINLTARIKKKSKKGF